MLFNHEPENSMSTIALERARNGGSKRRLCTCGSVNTSSKGLHPAACGRDIDHQPVSYTYADVAPTECFPQMPASNKALSTTVSKRQFVLVAKSGAGPLATNFARCSWYTNPKTVLDLCCSLLVQSFTQHVKAELWHVTSGEPHVGKARTSKWQNWTFLFGHGIGLLASPDHSIYMETLDHHHHRRRRRRHQLHMAMSTMFVSRGFQNLFFGASSSGPVKLPRWLRWLGRCILLLENSYTCIVCADLSLQNYIYIHTGHWSSFVTTGEFILPVRALQQLLLFDMS